MNFTEHNQVVHPLFSFLTEIGRAQAAVVREEMMMEEAMKANRLSAEAETFTEGRCWPVRPNIKND